MLNDLKVVLLIASLDDRASYWLFWLITYCLTFNWLILNPKALFASCIPEIIDLIGTRPKYGGTFKNERGRRQANTEWTPNRHFLFSIQKNAKNVPYLPSSSALPIDCPMQSVPASWFWFFCTELSFRRCTQYIPQQKDQLLLFKSFHFFMPSKFYIYSANESSDNFVTSFSKPLGWNMCCNLLKEKLDVFQHIRLNKSYIVHSKLYNNRLLQQSSWNVKKFIQYVQGQNVFLFCWNYGSLLWRCVMWPPSALPYNIVPLSPRF